MEIDITRPVVFAADCTPCSECGEPVCPVCVLTITLSAPVLGRAARLRTSFGNRYTLRTASAAGSATC